MGEKSRQDKEQPRVPLAVDGIQVNHCKNPICGNYGVPADTNPQPRGPGAASRGRDAYTRGCANKAWPFLKCRACGECTTIKSNLAIVEELARISAYLAPAAELACPREGCLNHGQSVQGPRGGYIEYGHTKAGSKRYKCKACGKALSRQRKPHLNKDVFKALVNKAPIKRICEMEGLHPAAVYGKIDFIHRQCVKFLAGRERVLLQGDLPLRRVYVCVDRQDHIVNWISRKDRRNVALSVIGSADCETGYVFGTHLNFDPAVNTVAVNQEAAENGDLELPIAWRRHARLWLAPDLDAAIQAAKRRKASLDTSLLGQIREAQVQAEARVDVETFERPTRDRKLPDRGMQVRGEYTMYAHFLLLRQLLAGAEKVRVFMDQDPGMRAACHTAFLQEIRDRRCDAFYVKINKDLTIDAKRALLGKAWKRYETCRDAHPDLDERDVHRVMVKAQLPHMQEVGPERERWLLHPVPSMSEPEKAACYLTDFSDYDDNHLANLYLMASLHAIDRYFMQLRRRISLLERPIATASNKGRSWYGYSAYDPVNIQKRLDIFRAYYNYCLVGQDKMTPAQRLGLAKGPVEIEKVLYC